MNTSTVIGKLLLTTAGAALLGFGAISTAQAATIGTSTTTVTPNGLETTEGNSGNGFPFDISDTSITDGGMASQRYQQVYTASEFDSLAGEGLLITQILFRPDATYGQAFSSVLPDIQINLSTTSAAADSLSTTFADNVGSDDTVVFSGALSLSSSNTGPTGGPKDFDIVINLTNPFLYNPNTGNLLLDVRNFGGGITTVFDAQFPLDPTSRAYTLGSSNVNAPTGSVDSVGLVTAFQGTSASPKAVPEPFTVGGTILAGGIGLLMKKKQAASKKAKK